MKYTILVIDDEEGIRSGLVTNFEMEDYLVKSAKTGQEGLKIIEEDADIDLVITDLKMDGGSGEEVLKRVVSTHPAIPVIILTGHGSIDLAVKAMRCGAYDFLTKPLNLDELNVIVKRALETRALKIEHKALLNKIEKKNAFDAIIGKSHAIQKVFDIVEKAAPTRATVLIEGESGTGKEVIANAIQRLSTVKEGAFIKVHCAALSSSLLESELFGYEKGAFTGALNTHKGLFEAAHGGTIFLDEIGEIDLNTQVKLLRVLQEQEIERVGSTKTIKIEVRVIAATNKNLAEEVKQGRFREDLYYRLNVINIKLPPLRERRTDIPLFLTAFIEKFNKENNRTIKGFDSKAKKALYNYSWPGNVREMQNVIESSCVLCDSDIITQDSLPPNICTEQQGSYIKIPYGTSLNDAIEAICRATLSHYNENKTQTAKVLGIERKTLLARLKQE